MTGGLTSLIQTLHGTARDNPFLVWNTLLALVPLGLAAVLFRDRVRVGVWWWLGAVAWVLFLPNAPYVLTDSVHLLHDIRTTSDFGVYFGVLPVYTAFFCAGFLSYVLSIRLLRRFLAQQGLGNWRLTAELSLHALCAVGVYLGRFVRLNSWDVVAAPTTVGATFDGLSRRFPIVIIVMTFVLLVVGTYVTDAVLAAGSQTAARVNSRFRPPFS